MKTFSFVLFATPLFWPVSGGFSGAYERLLPEFKWNQGHDRIGCVA
jgi:hypothetical protein